MAVGMYYPLVVQRLATIGTFGTTASARIGVTCFDRSSCSLASLTFLWQWTTFGVLAIPLKWQVFMQGQITPPFTIFDDYRYSQWIAVVVRWFLLAIWLVLLNYRTDYGALSLGSLNAMGVALVALNGYVHWRIWKGRPITRHYALALSIMDLAIITSGIGVTSRFDNTVFVFYYPALLGLALVFPSRRLSFSVVILVAVAYATLSVALEPGVSYAAFEEKVLIVRIATIFAVVATGNLLTRIEITRRREAVAAEHQRAEENLELQRKAQQAELAAVEERSRIAREIHDGIAQSIYMLSLNLETSAELARQQQDGLKERLDGLVALSKETLLEVRHYIFDLKPYLAGEKGVASMVENQVREFNTVARVPTSLETRGEAHQLPVPVATCLYRVTQEALANAFKHARASEVKVLLEFTSDGVQLMVRDNGRGFDATTSTSGHGLPNMRQRADELGGTFSLHSSPGEGTQVVLGLPC